MIARRKERYDAAEDYSFDWHASFRVTLEDSGGLREDDVRVMHCSAKFQYLYNYQGTGAKMVLTPTTERALHAMAVVFIVYCINIVSSIVRCNHNICWNYDC
jgi:hypothetical protein